MTPFENYGRAGALTLRDTHILQKQTNKQLDPSHLQKNFEQGRTKSNMTKNQISEG